ncbi:MAG TPA: sugar ABC transporter permease [Candidatus Sulfotelmatobacter sp.]|nr:sugar ABC transporter permease [Candidatus Sulfotelmatobacter sp.]
MPLGLGTSHSARTALHPGLPRRRPGSLAAHEARTGLLLALPAILFFSVFMAYPFLNAFWVSLTSWDLISPPRFIGLRNYVRLFSDPAFLSSAKVTAYYTLGLLVPMLPASLGLAVLLDRKLRGRGIYQGVLFAPVVLSMVAVTMIWRVVYMPQGGLYQLFTAPFGVTNIPWLNDADLAMPALIIVGVWKNVGYYMVLFLAGLQSISPVLYEAAKVDGANGWQQFRRITLPLLRPVLLFVAVVSMIKAFQAFSSAYTLTGGGPADATKVLPILVYQNAFAFNKMGYASAMAVVMFLVLLVLTIIQFAVLRPEE